ncbi:MAG: glycosyltransferase family 4 protein [Phycisphaerales bacterium]|nr:MAG: glycosyltransferase family 4 protein [Phycisphaerales bacterium]
MAETRDYSLLVLQDEAHYFDGQRYRSRAIFGYFLDFVARHTGQITVAVPTTHKGEPFGRVLDLPNLTYFELPYSWSLASYVKLSRSDRRTLKEAAHRLVSQHDAVMVRLPSLSASVFAREARQQQKTFVAYVVANILKAANPLRSSNLLIRIGARPLARYVHNVTMGMVSQADVALAVGRELYEFCEGRAPIVRQFIETLVSEQDLLDREDSFSGDDPCVLFRAARIDPNKGTEYLLEAVSQLVQRGYDVRLQLAGDVSDPAYLATLQRWCADHGIDDRVEWLGYVGFGPELFDAYRRAQIGVLSSLSEGFPRFIVEAWSSGLPVVSTDLPGLYPPVEANENAVLVEPASGRALADGIQRVIDDESLRRRIIKGGESLARENTLERQSKLLADLISEAVGRRRHDPSCVDQP